MVASVAVQVQALVPQLTLAVVVEAAAGRQLFPAAVACHPATVRAKMMNLYGLCVCLRTLFHTTNLVAAALGLSLYSNSQAYVCVHCYWVSASVASVHARRRV